MTETETISGAGLSGANPQPDTIADKKKQSKIELAVVNIICLLIFMAFGYIAIMSFFQTSVFDPADFYNEKVIFEADNIFLNVLFTVIFIAILFWLRRFCDFFAKVNIKLMEAALAVWGQHKTDGSRSRRVDGHSGACVGFLGHINARGGQP